MCFAGTLRQPDQTDSKMSRLQFPHWLAIVFVVYFVVLAIAPASRAVWVAEVIPVVIVFVALVLTYSRFRFSNAAYLLMGFWLFWHTLGGHFTFANVPFDWFNDLIGSERNHFDRVAHFSVGFWAYPIAEWLATRRLVANRFLLFTYPLLAIMSIAAM